MAAWRLVCAGCGAPAPSPDVEPHPFRCRCAAALPDGDHVVSKGLQGAHLAWPEGGDDNPFLRYRRFLYSYDVMPALNVASTSDAGGSASRQTSQDADYVDVVQQLDAAVRAVDGRGFRVTPFARSAPLSRALEFADRGGVWVKDETNNVSGSHKGRHLAGIMLYLQVLERTHAAAARSELAIASCGNAALAAAVVARATGWTLRTFIPPDARPSVVGDLRDLGAATTICPRTAGTAGDPCYHAFREAVAAGAIPFCCQGPENGLTIEGGETLAYEMIDCLGDSELDAIVVQVGGGALASACAQGFERARTLNRIRRMPRIYAAQTRGAAPLARAYDRVVQRVLARAPSLHAATREVVDQELAYAGRHRSKFMWPWEEEPRSIAHGILDDETYDWLAIVRGMLHTGGRPVTVEEQTLAAANELAHDATGVDVDHTGSAGLAGLMELRARGDVGPGDRVAVIFSGVRRH